MRSNHFRKSLSAILEKKAGKKGLFYQRNKALSLQFYYAKNKDLATIAKITDFIHDHIKRRA